jgi:hypothetical protein
MLAYKVLRRNEYERVLDAPFVVLTCFGVRTLEGIGAQVCKHREAKRHERVLPYSETYRTLL